MKKIIKMVGSIFKKTYSKIKKIRIRILIFERDSSSKHIPTLKKIHLNIKGFESNKWFLYNLKNNNINDYMSDYHRWLGREINKRYSIVLDDKIIASEIFGRYVDVPRNIAYIKNGVVRDLDNKQIIKTNNIMDYIKELNKITFKPIDGFKGQGVFFISVSNGEVLLNNEQIPIKKFNEILEKLDNYYISEFIQQHKYAQKLFKDTTNTIRVITMRDPYDNTIFTSLAAQRIGNKKSIPVDNWSNGGYSALIDVEKGIIETSASSFNVSEKSELWERHPDSGEQIKGIRIPNWEYMKNKIIETHEIFNQIHFIAWDIVITEDSFKVIELNASTDVDLFQVHKPLLVDDRIKRFYEFHEVV